MAKDKQPAPALKRIWVAVTSEGKILCIPHPDALPSLLPEGQEIIREFFYKLPNNLELFLKLHPEEAELFPKGFAWWIVCRVTGKEDENENSYGMLKRKLSEFSQQLFRAVRSLVCTIADHIKKLRKPKKLKKMLNPKKVITFDEPKKPEFAYHNKQHRWYKKKSI